MHGAIPPILQYAFMAWWSLKAQGKLYLYLYLQAKMSGCLGLGRKWLLSFPFLMVYLNDSFSTE
jgi:hypothetical protein